MFLPPNLPTPTSTLVVKLHTCNKRPKLSTLPLDPILPCLLENTAPHICPTLTIIVFFLYWIITISIQKCVVSFIPRKSQISLHASVSFPLLLFTPNSKVVNFTVFRFTFLHSLLNSLKSVLSPLVHKISLNNLTSDLHVT